MNKPFFESEIELRKQLTHIEKVFNTAPMLVERIGKDKVQKYYKDSKLGYTLVHSKEGSVHMALNYDGVYSKDGYYQQVREISKHLTEENMSVLELGCGKGFNSTYLAKAFPTSIFSGIDITKCHLDYAKKKAKSIANVNFQTGDFHALEQSDSSVDLVFELEAACYTDKPEVILSEVFRVLRRGGKFILYEGCRTENFENQSDLQKEAAFLIEKTMAVNTGHSINKWISSAENIGFLVEQNDDISFAIMPNLERFYRLSQRFFGSKIILKLCKVFLSENLIKNTIAGSLMPFSIMQKTQCYHRIVLVKKS